MGFLPKFFNELLPEHRPIAEKIIRRLVHFHHVHRGMTYADMAARTGVSAATLYRIHTKRGYHPTRNTLKAIYYALDEAAVYETPHQWSFDDVPGSGF